MKKVEKGEGGDFLSFILVGILTILSFLVVFFAVWYLDIVAIRESDVKRKTAELNAAMEKISHLEAENRNLRQVLKKIKYKD